MVIVGTNTTYLSNAINACAGKNFRQLVNDYRINYALYLMTKDEDLSSIRGLHLRCGFSSVSVFYDAFKRRTGSSPLQMLRESGQARWHHSDVPVASEVAIQN